MSSKLPQPLPDQRYVTIAPIGSQSITLPDSSFVSPADPEARRTVPSLSFLITHSNPPTHLPFLRKPDHGRHQDGKPPNFRKPLRMLFDLGLRKSVDRYLPQQQEHFKNREPHALSPSVAEDLEKGDVKPADIDLVILSHVHYDHHGDPFDFPSAHFLVGPEALNLLRDGLPGKGSHQNFDPDLLPLDRTSEFPFLVSTSSTSISPSASAWKPLGPFPAALDLLGDESIFVISAPGHLPGHVNLLCRLNQDKWIYLVGDSVHDQRLLTGEKSVGTWKDAKGVTCCIHLDKEMAEENIERIRDLMTVEGSRVEVVLAHDEVWKERNVESFYPSQMK